MTTPDQIKELNKRKGRRLTSGELSAIRNLHANGYTETQIAKRFGISHSTVNYHTPSRSAAEQKAAQRERQLRTANAARASVSGVKFHGKKRRLTATPPS